MNRFDIVGAIACKMSHDLSSCNPPKASIFGISFDDFVGWATHQTVFSVAFNSYPKTSF